MVKAAKAISSGVVAIVVIAMIIVVGLGVVPSGVLNSASSTTASTSSSSSSTNSIATSRTTGNSTTTSSSSSVTLSSNGLNQTIEASNSTLGLELVLSVNSTTIPSEDAISIAASVLNSRPTANNLTASTDWPVQGLTSGPCPSGGPSTFPAGIAVFRGYYGMNNLSSAKPLEIWPLITCPAEAQLNVTSYSFLPKDDVANYSGYPVTSSPPSPARQESYTRIAFGASIYAANGTGFYSSLDSSLPAAYTLVAGDEWGQIVPLYFKVTASDNLPKVGNFLSSTGGCSPGPCTGQRFSDALVFNCAEAAATPAGCAAIYSEGVRYSAAPPVNYTVTVWYPSYNQPNEPAWANCKYNVTPVGALIPPPTPILFGYCLMVNSTAFVVSQPYP
jgi:hypothetical protein